MEVPNDYLMCRFIRPGEWDFESGEPFPAAFRASDNQLSLYHIETVVTLGSDMSELCFGSLSGAGEAHLRASDFPAAASENSNLAHLNPKVVWRPDKVEPKWSKWEEAHAQVETSAGDDHFPHSYRVALVLKADPIRPPST